MTTAYKCDGCGALFEKGFPGLGRYMDLQNGGDVLVYLTIRGMKGSQYSGVSGVMSFYDKDVDLCNDCLAHIFAAYHALISNDLSPKEVKGEIS